MNATSYLWDKWRFGRTPLRPGANEADDRAALREAIAFQDERLRDLEKKLESVTQGWNNGPIPGLYFPVYLRVPGTAAVANFVAKAYLATSSFMSLRPVWATALFDSPFNGATYQVQYGATTLVPLFTVAMIVPTAGKQGAMIDKRGDFTTQRMTDDATKELRLRLDCTAIGAIPGVGLNMMIVFKALAKIEPA